MVLPSECIFDSSILNDAPNKANAIRFLRLLLGPEGVAIQRSVGPEPISPAVVGHSDYRELPAALRDFVRPGRGEL
jgi:hypothetical protein